MTGKTIEEVALRSQLNGNENVPFQEGSQYGRFQIKQLLRPEQVVDALNSELTTVPLSAKQGNVLKGLIDRINRDFGRYDTSTDVTLSQETSGKYINNSGEQVANASYGISAAVTLAVGDILLIPSASAVLAACSIVSEVTTNAQGETVYVPLMKRTTAAISEQGYYCFLATRPMDVVISGFTATVNGGTAIKVAWDIFKTIAATFETLFTDSAAMLAELGRKANIDGYYESMVVGTAKNLEGENLVDGTFISRTTGGDAEVGNGLAQIVEVKGKSLKFNQIVQNGNFATTDNWTGQSSMTLSASDNVLTASMSAGRDSAMILQNIQPIVGHKYLLFGKYKVNSILTNQMTVYQGYFGGAGTQWVGPSVQLVRNSWQSVSSIFTCLIANTIFYFGPYHATSGSGNVVDSGETVDYKDVMLFDLTAMGIDNLTTPEEVEAWLVENIGPLDYYPYNAGTVLNNAIEGIEGVGFNLLDPATGKAQIIGKYSDIYGNYYGIVGTHGALTFNGIDGSEETITPDAEGKFELTVPGVLTVATPGDDCAVFLWWDGSKKDFQPYEKSVAYLDVKHIYGKKDGLGELVQIFPDGLAGVGSVKDLLHIVDGVTVAERLMGRVDLGDLSWGYSGYFYANVFGKSVGIGNLICSRYANTTASLSELPEKSIRGHASTNAIYVTDSAYNDAATFKAAMNGVMLYYGLATPEHYTDLVYMGSEHFADGTPVELPTNYNVNNWGLENILPKNTEEAVVTGPAVLTCKYSINAVETLNTHTDQIEDLYDTKADKNGAYPGLVAGNLVDGNGVGEEQQFMFRPTGGTEAVAPKTQAVLQKYMGKTLAWNQLVKNGNFAAGSENWEASGLATIAAANNELTITLTADATSNSTGYAKQNIHLVAGRKYRIQLSVFVPKSGSFEIYAGAAAVIVEPVIANSWNIISKVFTALADRDGISFYPHELIDGYLNGDAFKIKQVQIIDLTLMFGEGNEPTTVEEFQALFPLPYYAYNEGTLFSNKADSIETVGFNQWDEEWEQGTYSSTNGAKQNASNYCRSANYIRVIPNSEIFIHCGTTGLGNPLLLFYYDADKNFIGVSLYRYLETENTIPDGAYYITFGIYNAVYGTTYNHDICINLSDPAKNGTYEPYEKHSTHIGLGEFQVKDGEGNVITVNGLKSAGTVYDEIVGNKYVKRIGEVDLGTLEWTLAAQRVHVFVTAISGKRVVSGAGDSNVICSKYATSIRKNYAGYDTLDKVVGEVNSSTANKGVVVSDSAYSDADTFKTAMSGVMLYYELDTPIEYDLVGSIPEAYPVFGDGTEAILPDGVDEETGVPETAPFRAVIFYSKDYLSQLNNMPEDYTNKESLVNMLEAFKTAGIIAAYTMTWDATNHRYTFTITAPTPEP